MKKYNTKKIISYILLIIWMILIFKFSSDSGKVSTGKSDSIINIANDFGLNLNNVFGTYVDFTVRKCGHLIEYLILYFLLYNCLNYNLTKKTNLKLSLFILFLYACSDEFHQLFVPGRSGQFKDVLIDTLGGFIGLVLIYYINRRKNKVY